MVNKLSKLRKKTNKVSGKDWLSNLFKENKISLITAEATSVAHRMCVNKPCVERVFCYFAGCLGKIQL